MYSGVAAVSLCGSRKTGACASKVKLRLAANHERKGKWRRDELTGPQPRAEFIAHICISGRTPKRSDLKSVIRPGATAVMAVPERRNSSQFRFHIGVLYK